MMKRIGFAFKVMTFFLLIATIIFSLEMNLELYQKVSDIQAKLSVENEVNPKNLSSGETSELSKDYWQNQVIFFLLIMIFCCVYFIVVWIIITKYPNETVIVMKESEVDSEENL